MLLNLTPHNNYVLHYLSYSLKKIIKKSIYLRFKWGKCSPSDRSSQDVERSVTDSHYPKLLIIIPFHCFMPLTQSEKVSFTPAYNNLAHISSMLLSLSELWAVILAERNGNLSFLCTSPMVMNDNCVFLSAFPQLRLDKRYYQQIGLIPN